MDLVNEIEAQIATVSPEAADKMLKTFGFSRQRRLIGQNIRRLGNEMVGGRFVHGTALTMAVLPDGTTVLINGHHTLHAIIRSGVPIRLVIIKLHVPDIQAASDIYSTFDLHKSRSWADAVRAAGLEDQVPMSSKVLTALGIIGAGFKFRTDSAALINSRKVRLDLLLEYSDEANLLHSAMLGAPKMNQRVILRSPVMAVALETAKYQPPRAYEFWGAVAHDDCLSANDPRKTLLRWLLSHPLGGGTTQIQQQCRAAQLAWNAWYRNDSISSLRVSSPGVSISGTPWGTAREPEPLPTDIFLAERPAPKPTPAAPDVMDLFDWGQTADQDGIRPVGFAHPPGRA